MADVTTTLPARPTATAQQAQTERVMSVDALRGFDMFWILGADSLVCGFAGPTCNAHGPNEKVRIPELDRGAEAIARMYAYLAAPDAGAEKKSGGKTAEATKSKKKSKKEAALATA